jgi:hypothetical protein
MWLTGGSRRYYLPHTRTRVCECHMITKLGGSKAYAVPLDLLAVPKAFKGNIPDDWVQRVSDLERPASSPLEAFLLPTDDPRIHRAREDLAYVQENMDGVRRAPTDWSRCESRHARARAEENLGHKRPLTAWQDGSGKTQLPDWAWGDWADAQTERVCDLMDISLLRIAKNGVDISMRAFLNSLVGAFLADSPNLML